MTKLGRTATTPCQRTLTLSTEGLAPKEANRSLRIQLAAAHRGLAEYGISDRVYNHLSVIAPAANGQGDVMLITPFPIDFADVTPSSLLGIELKEGDVVEGDGSLHQIAGSFHRGLYMARPETKCMMHTHSPHVCVLASMEDPTLRMLNQTSLQLHKQIGYDLEYGGLVDDLEEGQRLGRILGNKFTNVILRHHGSISVGCSIAMAFGYQIALEISAKQQVNAMQTGVKLLDVPADVADKTLAQFTFLSETPLIDAHLGSLIQKLSKRDDEFKL